MAFEMFFFFFFFQPSTCQQHLPVAAIFFLPLMKTRAHEWRKQDSRPLVEDGCRSVISKGGPEVDLQGTVTVGRGGVGQGTVAIRLNTIHQVYVTTPKKSAFLKI